MNLALAQMRSDAGAVDRNLDRALDSIAAAAANGADLVALPELFSVGYFAFDAYQTAAEPLTGPTLGRIADAAADAGIAVLAGTIIEDLAATDSTSRPATTGLANTAVLFDQTGTRQLVYRKHHLFGYESAEAALLVPGERLPTATINGFTIGVTTCYDLRFPELYRQYLDAGVTLTLVPSAWPADRVDHWQLLPRTRALENLMYLAAINGAGTIADTTLAGRSALYDPWGAPVSKANETADLPVASIDPDRVQSVRNSFPAVDDRRSE